MSHPRKKRNTRESPTDTVGAEGGGGSGYRFENERIPMAFFPLLSPHRFRRRAFVSRRLFYKTTIETVVLRTLYIYTCIYICTRTCVRSGIDGDNSGTTGGGGGGGGKKGPDAARTKDQKGEDPRRRAQRTRTRCKEIASPAKSRTPMQPPNQSSIRAIDSLRFQPADYLISTPLLDHLHNHLSPLSRSRLILVDTTSIETENEQGMLD